MPLIGDLARCEARKAELLRQSDANRERLAADAARLRPVAGWVDLGMEVAQKARAGMSILGPLLSLWKLRKQGGTGLTGTLARAFSIGSSIAGLWRSRRES